jgi:hypothetical protein
MFKNTCDPEAVTPAELENQLSDEEKELPFAENTLRNGGRGCPAYRV